VARSKGTSTSALDGLKPFAPTRYASVDLNRLTAFTISLLNELDVPTTLENIAVANFRMFPKRFAMVGYPEYPDIARVSRALLQLRPKYRNWATGKTKLGWQLTNAGVAEARVIREKLADNSTSDDRLVPSDLEAEGGGKNRRTIHPEDTTIRIRSSPLFLKYTQGWKEVDPLEVFDVLEAYTHTPADALRHKLRRMRSAAASVGDKQVVEFLDELSKRFALLFERR
jgi:hypothetical protein